MRKGFGRYGGDAFFDEERRIVKIELKVVMPLPPPSRTSALIPPLHCSPVSPRSSQEGPTNAIVTYRPGNRRWEYAKFVFRSTVFTMGTPPYGSCDHQTSRICYSLTVLVDHLRTVTLVDHLWMLHLNLANSNVLSLKTAFSATHPMRRFLTPFLYGTAAPSGMAAHLRPPRGCGRVAEWPSSWPHQMSPIPLRLFGPMQAPRPSTTTRARCWSLPAASGRAASR